MNAAATRIGFIGLGLMGHGIAKNLIAKGFPLTIRVQRNRKPAEDIRAARNADAHHPRHPRRELPAPRRHLHVPLQLTLSVRTRS